MAIALKRIMLITRNVQFAIDVKRALEALGEYSVATVAEVRNAIEQLRETPQQLVLLDTEGLTISPEIMVELMRARQSDIAIVLAPDRPEVHELARRYGVQGVVDIPVMARDLLPILDGALQDMGGALSETGETAAVDLGEDTIFIESLVDDFMDHDQALNYTRRRLQASYELLHPSVDSAAESTVQGNLEVVVEPDDEGDTVRYRYIRAEEAEASTTIHLQTAEADETPISTSGESETLRDLAQSLTAERQGDAEPLDTASAASDDESDLVDTATFQQMLNAVLDESTLLEDLTLESLFDTTRELSDALGTGAVPAWLRETEKFINEPSFLQGHLPPLEAPETVEGTTSPNTVDDSQPTDVEMEAVPAPADSAVEGGAVPPMSTAGESRTPLSRREHDPYLAQLAVTMTQQMTELTADATVLTSDNRIVAFSGQLALDDFRELRGVIGDDWAAQSNQARIRFIRLPGSQSDYMVYSRSSANDYTLSMIFGGGRRLREIRRQGDRMMSAIAAVPDGEASEPASEAVATASGGQLDADSRQPFAFVWLVADPAMLLRKAVAEQLVFWLEVQLNSLDWKISRLDVHQDFIYLYADVPGRTPPEQLMRTVMERSRKIVCSEDRALPDDLWADAYLVLQPGRVMSERELQSFLQFARD